MLRLGWFCSLRVPQVHLFNPGLIYLVNQNIEIRQNGSKVLDSLQTTQLDVRGAPTGKLVSCDLVIIKYSDYCQEQKPLTGKVKDFYMTKIAFCTMNVGMD